MTPVGVVGSSARAAVHSLARAGFSPSLAACRGEAPLHGRSMWAIDQFCDCDLKRVAACAVCPSDRYPDAIPELAKQFPPGPVLYTGGLENYPHVLRALASQRELWGNPPDVVESVRNPFTLFPSLAACGFRVPQLIPRGEPCPSEGRWLRKPLRSGGGFGIRFAHPGEPASPYHYFQEFIDGVPMSAVYCGTTLLGVTEQLIGEPWLHAKGFAYCGNIGPITLNTTALAKFISLGRAFAGELGLREHWGIDFLMSGEVPYPLELNPRYTASLEVIEHGTSRSAFQQWVPAAHRVRAGEVGKAIYYAPHTIRFPTCGPWDADLAGEFDPWRLPGFADIPQPGRAKEAGSPVFTFFATGSTPAEVRGRLQSRAAELDALFKECTP
jgi:predicted ATP-grasp superfamily ATP-dependent carboligase